jgi:hypothetical protein
MQKYRLFQYAQRKRQIISAQSTKTSQRPASQRPIKVLSYVQGELGYRDIIIMYIL